MISEIDKAKAGLLIYNELALGVKPLQSLAMPLSALKIFTNSLNLDLSDDDVKEIVDVLVSLGRLEENPGVGWHSLSSVIFDKIGEDSSPWNWT